MSRICAFQDCSLDTVGRGLCKPHYYKLRRNGKLPLKWCQVHRCDQQAVIGNSHYCSAHLQQFRKLVWTPIYISWCNMRARCNNPKQINYADYGGRGITHDPLWSNFMNFYQDMGSTYSEGLTLDRTDVNGNYEMTNCRWLTPKVQQNNRRNNHKITFDGRTQNIGEWITELGLNRSMVYKRLSRGWPELKSLGLSQ